MSARPKVFCIGLWKTGTKSFGEAMNTLGYDVLSCNWPIENRLGDPELSQEQEKKIKDVASKYSAFSDSPWLNIYKKLYEWYPHSKYVLTLRATPEKLAMSEYYHALSHEVKKEDIPPPSHYIDKYNKHNEEVRDFFQDKPGQLLEMCFENGDGWDKLCSYLEVTPPSQVSFPHVNKRGERLFYTYGDMGDLQL